jgi:hypothetical protein
MTDSPGREKILAEWEKRAAERKYSGVLFMNVRIWINFVI